MDKKTSYEETRDVVEKILNKKCSDSDFEDKLVAIVHSLTDHAGRRWLLPAVIDSYKITKEIVKELKTEERG